MKIRTLILAGVIVAASSLSAMAQYTIVSSVIGSGGGPATSDAYTINGTVGQAIIGPAVGSPYTFDQGFWYTLGSTATGVHQTGLLPEGYALGQNYPNPFNPSTSMSFSVPERVKVTMRVLNLLGEEVARPIDGVSYESGTYKVDFYAKDLPSGTYVYRLEAGNIVLTKKMVLMR